VAVTFALAAVCLTTTVNGARVINPGSTRSGERQEDAAERQRKRSIADPQQPPFKVDLDDSDELGLALVQGFASMVRVFKGC
jgi:hypothetical protein